ncbi:nucleotide sugar dehydrogenase [Gammaproteobacteria bacterium]|jgi:UDP-N-acetyl-D-glucosamine/UDP-N-acetyl-D-galactosamine dehydrogenase|nr:nucleotide sugar dehydrogenase [Gammaproteobacteria bacterium]MDC0129015.1 nucleotide sugar dehydrogenase [Gammaproteobacteria bacterium]
MKLENKKIAILGLGYVGLPLAVEFGKKFSTIGFDINKNRIGSLKRGIDKTKECSKKELKSSQHLKFTCDEEALAHADIFIITVPTPIDEYMQPDLKSLIAASNIVAKYIKRNSIVIYESTVYPGATEEVCIPILENISQLKIDKDFGVGYSPERVNPGDKQHRIIDIQKVTSGSSPKYALLVDKIYKSIISAGTHKAPSIKTAEAAKIIENVQRDVNIALINELSILFHKLSIDTNDVLNAAATKWNFIKFNPGLVGGHCIGVDPYYLTHKAQSIGFHPEMILAGRRTNDGMAKHVASLLVTQLARKKIHIRDCKLLIMGYTFKENCPDIRNTKIKKLVDELSEYGMQIDVFDPWLTPDTFLHENANLIKNPNKAFYDAIIIAVPHSSIINMGIRKIKTLLKKKNVLFDMKGTFKKEDSDLRL